MKQLLVFLFGWFLISCTSPLVDEIELDSQGSLLLLASQANQPHVLHQPLQTIQRSLRSHHLLSPKLETQRFDLEMQVNTLLAQAKEQHRLVDHALMLEDRELLRSLHEESLVWIERYQDIVDTTRSFHESARMEVSALSEEHA